MSRLNPALLTIRMLWIGRDLAGDNELVSGREYTGTLSHGKSLSPPPLRPGPAPPSA